AAKGCRRRARTLIDDVTNFVWTSRWLDFIWWRAGFVTSIRAGLARFILQLIAQVSTVPNVESNLHLNRGLALPKAARLHFVCIIEELISWGERQTREHFEIEGRNRIRAKSC